MSVPGHDGPGHGWNGAGAGDDPPPLDVVVPDDIRELEPDIRAYHWELRRKRFAARLRRTLRRMVGLRPAPSGGRRERRRARRRGEQDGGGRSEHRGPGIPVIAIVAAIVVVALMLSALPLLATR